MWFRFECRWCGKQVCDAEGRVCSVKCEEQEKSFKVAEVLANLDGDRWAAYVEYVPLDCVSLPN
jgi:hypothetical protein